jgi:tripartite-type tricarboxylate transporter receptor subunit TctC
MIDNRSGAQGIIGTAYAARAPADGYTILQTDGGSLVMNPWLYRSVDYHPVKDFTHVSLATRQPVVAVLNPRVPAHNLKELAALARRTPNGLTFASGGGPGHLAGELFSIVAKVRMLHVPYKGGGPAITDVAGGHVDLMFPSPPSSVSLIQSGKLRAIAVTSAKRLPALPDVPTAMESGFPEFDVKNWYGLALPANTPYEIVMKLNREFSTVMKMPAIQSALIARGFDAETSSPEEMTSLVRAEYERWGKVVKAARIKPQ